MARKISPGPVRKQMELFSKFGFQNIADRVQQTIKSRQAGPWPC